MGVAVGSGADVGVDVGVKVGAGAQAAVIPRVTKMRSSPLLNRFLKIDINIILIRFSINIL